MFNYIEQWKKDFLNLITIVEPYIPLVNRLKEAEKSISALKKEIISLEGNLSSWKKLQNRSAEKQVIKNAIQEIFDEDNKKLENKKAELEEISKEYECLKKERLQYDEYMQLFQKPWNSCYGRDIRTIVTKIEDLTEEQYKIALLILPSNFIDDLPRPAGMSDSKYKNIKQEIVYLSK